MVGRKGTWGKRYESQNMGCCFRYLKYLKHGLLVFFSSWRVMVANRVSSTTRTTPDHASFCIHNRNWYSLVRMFMSYSTRCTHMTLHIRNATYFVPYAIILIERTSIVRKSVKSLRLVHLLESCQVLGGWNHEAASDGRKCSVTKSQICGWINLCTK